MKNRNQPCIVCGKPTAFALGVNYDNQSGSVVAPNYNGPESGIQPIGSDCAKKIPTAWVLRMAS
jgi:hypothetical protein